MQQTKLFAYILFFFGATIFGCSNKKQTILPEPGFISVSGNRFVDAQNRTIIFNGLNHVNKQPESHYLNADDSLLFRRFRSWGINCIRFGINWDGLEPEPGNINETYLKEIDKRVKWAEENGIWLILDMHQDLYSRKYGNGAPEWATIDDNVPHYTGEVWSEAYIISPAVHHAFDNFWKNAPAPDGKGIQDHYINLWKIIAQRYADAPSIAGFDIMNEPFIGSDGQQVFADLIQAYAKIAIEGGKLDPGTDISKLWDNDSLRAITLQNLDDVQMYTSMMRQPFDVVRNFEENTLSSFYQRVRDTIRTVNKTHILFLEHNYFCNLGIPSALKVPVNEAGQNDPRCAYAPHGYDLVVDTDGAENPGYNRLKVIFDHIFQTGKRMNVPVVVGEWGAYYLNGNDYTQPACFTINTFEKALAGQTYWSYWDKIETQAYFTTAIARIYPMSVNGILNSYTNDFDSGTFQCQWSETDSDAPTVLFIPDLNSLNKKQVRISPISEVQYIPIADGSSGYMIISSLGQKRSIHAAVNDEI